MRRASPSPGTPFPVPTGPTSGFLRGPVRTSFTPLAGPISSPGDLRCDVLGAISAPLGLLKHGLVAEVVVAVFLYSFPPGPPGFPVEKDASWRNDPPGFGTIHRGLKVAGDKGKARSADVLSHCNERPCASANLAVDEPTRRNYE